jgi:hypothetical protein
MPNFKVFAALGVPGLALGVFFYLFISLKWSLAGLSPGQTFAGAVIFMVLIAAVIAYFGFLHRPQRDSPTQKPVEGAISVVFPSGWTFEKAARDLAKKRVVQFDGFDSPELGLKLAKAAYESPSTIKAIESLYAHANGKLPRFEVIDDNSGRLIVRKL